MKAIICPKYGEIALEDVPAPNAGPGQVVLTVRACGVNFPDTLIVAGKYQFKPDPPFSPGGEIAGEVKAVGPGVTHVRPGDRVAAMTIYGGYAEEIAVGASQVLPLPEGLDFAQAACSLTTYGTTWHALVDRAALQAGEWLLVLGAAGGVGLAAVEMGKQLGARVIAAASSAAKLELCKQYGADAGIDYSREDLKQRVKELTGAMAPTWCMIRSVVRTPRPLCAPPPGTAAIWSLGSRPARFPRSPRTCSCSKAPPWWACSGASS
jgi:NADPH2:quinone reductase